MRIVLATRNQGKIEEFRNLLAYGKIEIVGLDQFPQIQDIEETGTTFKENAALKAKTVAEITGLPAIADDSGLVVDVLQGAPGVNSARFAGDHGNDQANNEKILKLMEHVPDNQRSGRFCCAIAISIPLADTYLVEGSCAGTIARRPVGGQGFGYDPLFIPEGYTVTMGQMAATEKNKISHRAKAVKKAIQLLEELKEEFKKTKEKI